jgi:hypothetical protein
MNIIREKYKGNDKNLLFHIYSQGNITNFLDLNNTDVLFHLNENIEDTFIGLVAANILVISPSSLSYVAGLISDGIIYYKPFWHSQIKDHIFPFSDIHLIIFLYFYDICFVDNNYIHHY